MFGALLAFSPQLGQPPKRNNPNYQITLPLCSFCGALGLLGTFSFQIDLQISSLSRGKKEKFFFLPRFCKIDGEDLLNYIAVAKHIRPYLSDIPAESALLTLLSLYPHISRLKMPETFFVARGDFSGNASRYQDFREESAKCELSFLKGSSYNVALAQNVYQEAKNNPELIRLLAKTLKDRQPRDAISFYREYASASDGKYLVYYDSTRFIAKEVLGMNEELLDDPNIGAVASMLKFFVRKQKFGYVDNLRGSRTEDEFEKHLLSALRDAASVHSKPEDKKDADEKRLYIPNETEVREFLKVLHKEFEKVRTLVCLLSFTYWKKEVEQDG
jgi:CRISPR type I-A-associated protein Csa5